MGRIKTMLIKRTTVDLLEQHGEKFTDDFQKNKQVTHQIIGTPSKKLRNVIAGYATRLKRRGSDL